MSDLYHYNVHVNEYESVFQCTTILLIVLSGVPMWSRVEDAHRGRASLRAAPVGILRTAPHGCSCIVHVYIYSVAKLAVARVFSRIDFQ